METVITSVCIVCIFSQIFNLVIVGRFIDIIDDMHKREFRKNNTKQQNN